MKVKSLKVAGIATALLGSAISANAGGLERSSQDFDILFEQGTVVDTTGTFVAPQRKLKNIRGSGIGALTPNGNPYSGGPYKTEVDEAKSYWVPKFSAKVDLTDDLACAAQYRQPWGIHTDVGYNTVRSFVAVEQKISSNDYGLNCSYRFAAGEKGYFRILGGVSYQELKGEQTRILPSQVVPLPGGGSTTFPFRIGTLDVEDKNVGWRIGAAYELPEYAIRASLVYQSKVSYDLKGDVGNIVPGTNVNVLGEVATPQSLEFKFQTGIAPDWLAFGSVKWVDWSSIDRVSFVNDSGAIYAGRFLPGQEVTALNLYFKDGWTVSGGVGHKFNEQWSAAATVTWDRGTTTGLTSQTDVWLFGLGTNYKATENFEVRLAGAAGMLTSGQLDDRGVGTPGLGSIGEFGNDFVGALSLTAKVKF